MSGVFSRTGTALRPPDKGPDCRENALCSAAVGAAAGLVLLLAGTGSVSAAEEELAWQVLKGKHFLVYYQLNRGFADDVRRRAEVEYDRITHDLDFTRYDGFWLWDRRVPIRIYATREAFVSKTGSPAWAAGKANYVNREIVTFEGSDRFLESVLPHEMTHLIFREFVGFTSDVPLWLDEGVAQWEDLTMRDFALDLARKLLAHDQLMSLDRLTRTDVRRTHNGLDAVRFYAQAVSLVGFMIEEYGARRFRKFCGQLRDGKSLDEALRFTYPSTIRNLKDLESAWRQTLGGETP